VYQLHNYTCYPVGMQILVTFVLDKEGTGTKGKRHKNIIVSANIVVASVILARFI